MDKQAAMDKLIEAAAEALKAATAALGKAAAGIGVQAERLWPLVIKAVWAKALGELIVLLVLGGFVVHYCRYFIITLWKWDTKDDEPSEMGKVFGLVACLGVAVAYTMTIYNSLPTLVATLISPEGQFVIDLVQKALEAKPK